MKYANTCLSLSVLVAFSLPLAAQDAAHQIIPTPGVADLGLSANLPIQKVGPEDLLGIQVYNAPELSRTARISAQGTIRLPMLKNELHVTGLFPSEIEDVIAGALKREELFVDPFVTVTVVDYHSRPISVTGAVKIPTIFQAIGTVTLLDALARAGGLVNGQAGPEIIVTRPNGDAGPESVQRIPVKPLLNATDPELNLKLTGGEQIRVPDVGQIIVAGSVVHPGTIPVLDGVANTVMTAIAQAQGTIQYYKHIIYIYRPDDKGTMHEITVNLGKIQARKEPDVTLQAHDVLYVPDSSGRRITQEAVTAMTSVGQALPTALLYVYR
jgi:polysaccharide export outer membrane protein